MALSCLSVVGNIQTRSVPGPAKVAVRNKFIFLNFEQNPPVEQFNGVYAMTVVGTPLSTANPKNGTTSIRGLGTLGSYVRTTRTDISYFSTLGVSYCFWIYLTGTNTTTTRVFECAGGSNIFTFPANSQMIQFCGVGNTLLLLNTWYHIVGVINGSGSASTNTCSLYINGTLSTSSVVTGSWQASPLGFYFGSGTGTTNATLNGYMDDVRIYNANLTQAEVTAVYTDNTV